MSALVGIIMGSGSDWEIMSQAAETLDALAIPYETRIVSAHRTPDLLFDYCSTARQRGLKLLIAGAGLAAGLPGMAAAKTPLPVLGVPQYSRAVGGMDALLSMVQMPAGIPVGTLAIGKPGAVNAALLAAAILALSVGSPGPARGLSRRRILIQFGRVRGRPVLAEIPPFQPHHQAGDHAAEAQYQADRRPIPVVQINRRGQGQQAADKIEIREYFVDRFRQPKTHSIFLLIIRTAPVPA
jgi:5-(carboxyamino)imidazole ribonucleotide mutase